jgi:hypothetical protein
MTFHEPVGTVIDNLPDFTCNGGNMGVLGLLYGEGASFAISPGGHFFSFVPLALITSFVKLTYHHDESIVYDTRYM